MVIMRALVVYNPKYGKYDGIHCGKVVSRCASVDKVCEYFISRGFDRNNIEVSVGNSRTAVMRPVVADNYSDIHQRLKNEVLDVCERASKVFNVSLNPPVKFYSRGTVAGKAHYRDMSVSFNEVLAKENGARFNNTVIHEVAHLVVKKLYPFAKAHGSEFKRVMQQLGGDGKTCHSYDVSSVKVKRTYTKHVATCACHDPVLQVREHLVSPTVARRVVSGATYRCRKCRAPIVMTGRTTSVTK